MISAEAVRIVMAAIAASPENTRLDKLFRNVNTERAIRRTATQQEWEKSRALAYWKHGKMQRAVKLSAVSHSWATEDGCENIAKLLRKRCARMLAASAAKSALAPFSERPKMITLTYADAGASWAVKDALRAFLRWLRRECAAKGCKPSYLYVAELQPSRVAVHYHLVITGMPYIPKERLAAAWGHGFVKIRAVPLEGSLPYCMKYVRKSAGIYSKDSLVNRDKQLIMAALCRQQGIRRHGCSRDLSAADKHAPAWVQEACAEKGWPVAETTYSVVEPRVYGELVHNGEWAGVCIDEYGHWQLCRADMVIDQWVDALTGEILSDVQASAARGP